MAGLYGASGIGFWSLLGPARVRLRESSCGRLSFAALVAVFGWMAWHATTADFRQLDEYRRFAGGLDPCLYLKQYPANVRKDVVVRLKTDYKVRDPTCSKH